MTEQTYREQYMAGADICPYCGVEGKTEVGPISFRGHRRVQEVECNDCGMVWKDIYKLIDIDDKNDDYMRWRTEFNASMKRIANAKPV